MIPRVVILGIFVLLVATPREAARPYPSIDPAVLPAAAFADVRPVDGSVEPLRGAPQALAERGRTVGAGSSAVAGDASGGAPQHNPALTTAPATGPYQRLSGPALIPAPLTGTPADFTSQGSIASGIASWFEARGDQAAVPWWKPGQDPLSAEVCAFDNGTARCVAVLITGFCQCLVGTERERAIDLSRHAFAQLADPAVGLIRVTIEIPTQGPQLPSTDQVPVQ